VVNDYGVFARLLKLDHPNIKIIWGNFLSGQNKDPYLDLFKDKSTHEHITIDNAYFAKIFAKHGISAYELYHVFQGATIETLLEKRYLYAPYVVYSLTRYCVPALLSQKRDYLTIVENCPGCASIVGEDLTMELKIGEERVANIYR
jgi:hypothetical protein